MVHVIEDTAVSSTYGVEVWKAEAAKPHQRAERLLRPGPESRE